MKIDRVCFMDLETFWSQTHTLSKMNPVAYCMHKDTEIQSMSYAFGKESPRVLWGEKAIKDFIASQDWSSTLVVGHNMSQFDSMILAWRCGLRPGMWGCTLAMAAPLFRSSVGGSLKALCEHFGLGKKGNLEAIGTRGRKLASFTASERLNMEKYNNQDVELCRRLFFKLRQYLDPRELKVIDMTIRMLVQPKLRVDIPMLETALKEEHRRKVHAVEALRVQLGVPFEADLKAALMSNQQFADLLKHRGVEPPTKTSPITGKETFAFAKSDDGMLELLEHYDPQVTAMVETRLGIKSTILASRIETFLTMARATGGRMPIALNYWGAHTGRWSGGFSANQQNLPRVKADKPKPTDALRQAIIAPKGYKIVAADLSGIELRVNHFLWKVPTSMELYAKDAKADLYKNLASKFYNVIESHVTDGQRQFAKMMSLALGFGMGWRKFQAQAASQGVTLSDPDAKDAVNRWRNLNEEIVAGWDRCDNALIAMGNKEEFDVDDWGLCVVEGHRIATPHGQLQYKDLRREEDTWVYGHGRHKMKTYGAKIVENLVQHLARQVLVGHLLEIQKRYQIAHTVHDECILVVKEDEAKDALNFMLDVMKTPPAWWPELVLWAEGGIGDNYGECK